MIGLLVCGLLAFMSGLIIGIEATRHQVLTALRRVNDERSLADRESGRELIRTVERVTRGR